MTSTKSQGWSINGDTPEDEDLDHAGPPITAERIAELEKESKGDPLWDPDSHIGPLKTAGK